LVVVSARTRFIQRLSNYPRLSESQQIEFGERIDVLTYCQLIFNSYDLTRRGWPVRIEPRQSKQGERKEKVSGSDSIEH
jgi:hypothetical protein